MTVFSRIEKEEKNQIQELKKEVDQLKSLLDEKETGCSCWWEFLDERINNINMIYYGRKNSATYSE